MSPRRNEPLATIQAESPAAFGEVLALIRSSRQRALQAAHAELVGLYWTLGRHLSQKVAQEGWGQGTVQQLAVWLQGQEPGLRGFSAPNLWRMKQYFETYQGEEKLSTLSRVLSWSHNTLLLSKCKSNEERVFYLHLARQERWSVRQLERQVDGALFERTLTGKPKLSTVLREVHPGAESCFKDRYLVDFLDLPEPHSEKDLQRGLIAHLKDFLLELGRDFCFIGSEFPLKVGAKDFYIDLLLFHRGLQALVAFELKIGEFHPADMGQLSFYLEALDRDHKKAHEAPSIGILLCKTQDHDVVEYSLSRTLSPALVAEYQTRLPNKDLLQSKLEEFYAMVEREREES